MPDPDVQRPLEVGTDVLRDLGIEGRESSILVRRPPSIDIRNYGSGQPIGKIPCMPNGRVTALPIAAVMIRLQADGTEHVLHLLRDRQPLRIGAWLDMGRQESSQPSRLHGVDDPRSGR